jgi:signal transduction histidine kinase
MVMLLPWAASRVATKGRPWWHGLLAVPPTASDADGGRLVFPSSAPSPGRSRASRATRALLEAQEAERRRLARDLHDVIGQTLVAVKMSLEATRRAASGTGPDTIQACIDDVSRAITQVREFSLDLRPPILDDLGLVAAIRTCVTRAERTAGLCVGVIAEPVARRLDPEVETACFRIVQEAIANVVRHAQARQLTVVVRVEREHVVLEVTDDGIGVELGALAGGFGSGEGLGILGMAERARLVGGSVTIVSRPGGGRGVEARVPARP